MNNINIIDFCPNIENKEYSLNPTPDILFYLILNFTLSTCLNFVLNFYI